MRKATVLYNGHEAGELSQLDDGSFIFRYNNLWFDNEAKPAISLTLPKTSEEHKSNFLFSFFFNMLPEGANKQVACRQWRIDLGDHFGLLLATAENDTIGAVTVKEIAA